MEEITRVQRSIVDSHACRMQNASAALVMIEFNRRGKRLGTVLFR